ncbi:hypothetical protein BDQ17DRAFT_1259957, partial [Cyathus striatus]
PPLQLTSFTINSATSIHFLGVLIDNELQWVPQQAAALAKGQGWLLNVWRLTRPLSGATAEVMHCLYISMAVPHMMYTIDVWAQPLDLDHDPSNIPAQLHPLAQIH